MTIVVVMGVSGSGKTTIADGVARAQGWQLLEGDAFHPPSNIAKMESGTPLTDEDRWPWLQAIAHRADELQAAGQSVVIACSVLKRAYRAIVIGDRDHTLLVYLRGSKQLIHDRMAARKGHFMPAALLDSQFATLEEPGPDENAIVVDIGGQPQAIIDTAVGQIRRRAT
jgi:gluconokinase